MDKCIFCKEEHILRKDGFCSTSCFNKQTKETKISGYKGGCGRTIVLNADHIKPWSIFPEFRWDISNGRTLCIDCHKKTDTYMGRIKNYKLNQTNYNDFI